MSTLAYNAANNAHMGRPSLLSLYANNLGHAIRLLWGALLARNPKQVERQLSRRQRVKAIQELNAMAQDMQDSMPGLASELRYLAGRG
ncbi:MAG: hypothetical protein ABI351_05030 [Herbaspirillum sp.]